MKEKFAQNTEVPVSVMESLLQTQGTFGGFFLYFRSPFVCFLVDKMRNSNVFCECCSDCVSMNVFLRMCFQIAFSVFVVGTSGFMKVIEVKYYS